MKVSSMVPATWWLIRMLRSVCVLCLLLSSIHTVSAGKCDTCKDMVKNINEGIKNTAKSNFGGGNTKWEEQSLGSYTFSETRLLEILEAGCKDGSKECHHMLEEHEEALEHWWFKQYAKGKHKDLHTYFCIGKLQVCCPSGTFGPDCKECPAGKDRPCKGNGRCLGDGSRDGSGKCSCDAGYRGDLCDECKDNFYEESKNDTHTVCKACDRSCESLCSEAGPKGCDDCKTGWTMSDEDGCTDIDECESSPCEEDQYCSNSVGSFRCSDCDKACAGCTGPGPKNCEECAQQFFMKNQICVACHPACESSCTDDTPLACDACREGWLLDPQQGCVDVNECEEEESPCDSDEHCINSQGSYKCSTCHPACVGCTGPSSADCVQCKAGYTQIDGGGCMDDDECDHEDTCTDPNTRCINNPGSYTCACSEGYVRRDGVCIAKKDAPRVKPSTESSSSPTPQNTNKNTNSDKSLKPKKKKKSSSKSPTKEEKLSKLYMQYWGSLVGFALLGVLLRSSIFSQVLWTFMFWIYLFYIALKMENLFARKS